MGKIFFLGMGILFWAVLSGWRNPWFLALGAGMSLWGTIIVRPQTDPKRMTLVTLKLPLFFLEALRQAFVLSLSLYDHPSQFQKEVVNPTEEEIFAKTVLVTLTPYTLVVKEEQGELLIHSMKEERH